MGLIRTLLYLIIGGILWYSIRNFLRKEQRRKEQLRQQQRSGSPQPGKPVSSRIVKCEHCALHLPEAEAVAYQGQWFCSPAHMERWLAQQRNP